MKLKKILSVILSAALAINCAFVMCFTSNAEEVKGFVDFSTIFQGTEYGSLSGFLYVSNPSGGENYNFNLRANSDGKLPTVITYSDMQVLDALYKNGGKTVTLTFNIIDPETGTEYTCAFSSKDVASIGGTQMNNIKNAGGINIALKFSPDKGESRLNILGYDKLKGDIGIPISYKITYSPWTALLISANLPTTDDISAFSIDTSNKIGTIKKGVNAAFSIDDSSRSGVYFIYIENDSENITKKEAVAMLRSLLLSHIGLTEKDIDGEDFENLKTYIDDAVDSIKAELTQYVKNSELEDLVNKYIDKNKTALVDAVLADQRLEDKIADSITDILGNEVTLNQQKALIEYINDQVTDEVAKHTELLRI